MIFGNLENLGNITMYPEAIQKALSYLKEHDFTDMPSGNYELQGRDLYAQVFERMTVPAEQSEAEVHRKYIDLQYLVRGHEQIGYAPDVLTYEVKEDKLEEKDVLFYKNVERETFLEMKEKDFAVFFPNDIHRPTCMYEEQEVVKKVVLKISVDLI